MSRSQSGDYGDKLQSMRREEFTDAAPGTLVPLGDAVAFLPDPAPPVLAPSWDLARKVDFATASLASLVGQSIAVSNHQLLMRALLAREAVDSNRIEGTHTHIVDVLRQEALGPPSDGEKAARNGEVLRSMDATVYGEQWIGDGRPLSTFLVRALHRELLTGTRGGDKHPGEFRTGQVAIGKYGDSLADAEFVPPPPEHVPGMIDALVEFMRADQSYPPLVAAAIAHYQFEAIHPFEDGNGRLGRVLITLMLLDRNIMDWPVLFLSPFFRENDRAYRDLLKRVSTHGEWSAWISFFLDGVAAQANDAKVRAKRVMELHSQYRRDVQLASRSRTALVAVDFVMERAIVTIPQLAAFAGCDYKTARLALEAMERVGAVASVPGTHPLEWIANELIEEIYTRD